MYDILLRDVVAQYDLEEVVPFIGRGQRKYGKYMVKMNSTKLKLFAQNLCCVRCEIIGFFFRLERHKQDPPERAHFNLYALSIDGSYILMTQDHIIPKSRGGKDTLDNLQTMCRPCNARKGNNPDHK